jgi:adenine-specific DNA methylase
MAEKTAKPIKPKGAQLSFIETQFPVSKMSIESFRERTAKQGQTLTGLGKWWGRKPLVLCRATILGLLLPATDNPAADRDVFLRLMTMDTDGLLRRRNKNMSAKDMFERLVPAERSRYLDLTDPDKPKIKGTKEEKEELQKRIFLRLPYNEKMEYVCRPEQVDGPSPESWKVINAHLKTHAKSLPELVAELGKRRFGHVPRVGDSFCGGGSIPFEAARLGCDAYGSDLNPVAALLTWAALNIVGGGEKVAEQVQQAQREVFDAVDNQITEWGIEHGEPDPKTKRCPRADAYLYCVEVTCPECGWRVPLAPSWVIGKGSMTIARLIPNDKKKRFDFEIHQGVKAKELASAGGTVADSQLICPHCQAKDKNKGITPIKSIRGDGRGTFGDSKSLLRGWENDDLVPRSDDIFGERLYCIRWVDPKTGERHFATPTDADIKRENRVLSLLQERFADWQKRGNIPSRRIEPGNETTRLGRERGWTHWHHLFTPRQLLTLGLFSSQLMNYGPLPGIALALFLGRMANWSSRLCNWNNDGGNEKTDASFTNNALNTMSNFGCRSLTSLSTAWFTELPAAPTHGSYSLKAEDARSVNWKADCWITDPPYADAVNYEELSEFFLAWYPAYIRKWLPGCSTETRRVLAVKGDSDGFTSAMVSAYRALNEASPDSAFQVVMFTHQDAAVWAGLSLILWAAGLTVTAAWCIATETTAGTKKGNYVQGTVILVLRKQRTMETAFLDEVYNEVESEVRRQLDSMKDLDDASDPNFSDTDYQLAAYAAALRVLTSKKIEEIDVAYELTRTRVPNEKSQVEQIIEKAVQIACDHLVPRGIDTHLWKSIGPMERFYLKGLEMEGHGERREGVYQELARGFRVPEYRPLLASTRANETRLKTATEFGRREMGDVGFGASLVRHTLFAAFKTAETEGTRDALNWLRTEVPNYAAQRPRIIEILEFFATFTQNATLEHWHKDAHAAALVAGAMRNREDHV